jgi:DNA-binding NarL/FixJ family response regulator
MRVLIAEDSVLLREGAVRLLESADFEVVAQAGDAPELMRKTRAHKPDVLIADIRMPPEHGDDGLRAAIELRSELPEMGVLILSQYVEEHYAQRLLADDAVGVGYLLKDRIADVDAFIDAVRRVGAGGVVLDPEVVAHMLGRRREQDPLHALTARERDVLAAIAEGYTNRAIAERLHVSERAVERHVTSIFEKLELANVPGGHRRVLSVLAFLSA